MKKKFKVATLYWDNESGEGTVEEHIRLEGVMALDFFNDILYELNKAFGESVKDFIGQKK